jgi:hypothetical protein
MSSSKKMAKIEVKSEVTTVTPKNANAIKIVMTTKAMLLKTMMQTR